ncbi:DUF421 domain-containing protein [Litchfieldia alkalitelluris]|uniref:DUF421 domain-containing protein n=1 Tax=Litchfieldia alkalitelluris TaxID=304268 RepID=UPI0009968116|nr:DUF421 domain-containing protein [Litchfieldia alkalitelluris]
MEIIKDILVVYGRIVTIIPLLLIVTLLVGKRSIGEIPVFDFIIIITLGSVVGADIADPSVNHLPTAIAVISIGLLQRLIAGFAIKYRWFGKMVTFEPTIVIKNGEFMIKNMKRIRYSLDNILMMLREQGVFDSSDVELALIEANGNLSVHKKAEKNNVTIEDLKLQKKHVGIAYPVLVEGKIYTKILNQFNLDDKWLLQQFNKKGLKPEDIFFASLTANHEIQYSLFNNKSASYPEFLN